MDLENEMRTLINEVIGGKYIGKLKVDKEDIDGEDPLWGLFMYLDMEMSPLVLAKQGSLDDFKKFVRKEIKTRKLEGVSFWKAEREIINEEEEYE